MSYYRQASISFGPPLTRMVKYLIVINSAAFLLTYFLGSIPSEFMQLYFWAYPKAILGLEPYYVSHYLFLWQLATYLFLHAGWLHIIFNMFALWMFGADLERRWGSRQFLKYYFLTGIGAGIFDVLLQPSSKAVTIGCSGAVFGLLLAYGMLFPNRPIFLWLIIPIKAKWFVVIMGLIELYASWSDTGAGVSHVSHLGGMLFGYLYLRGTHFPQRWQVRYQDWRRARLRRKFEVYMRKHEKKDDAGNWIN
jgi:membrane associated rhomboid family serine protease